MDNLKIEYYYLCYRCLYETKFISDIERHLNKKKKCEWDISVKEKKSDFEVYNESISKKYKNIEEYSKKINELNNLNENLKNKNLKCKYCLHIFSNKGNLVRHYDKCDKKKILDNFNKINNDKLTNNNESNNIKDNNKILNINNNNVINNINNENKTIINNNIENQNIIVNNITINIDSKCIDNVIKPFYDKFDTSHLSDEIQLELFLSNQYEDTLREMLKNELNLNFYFQDSYDNKSVVYLNHDDKIKRLDNDEIYDIIWKKIKDFFLEKLENIKLKRRQNENILKIINAEIEKKYTYLKSENIQYANAVKNLIKKTSNIYKENAINKLKNIDNNLIEDNI